MRGGVINYIEKEVVKEMQYKGVIFDLDGVICYTDKYHYMAWKQIADETGVYFDETINDRLRGVSRTESLNIILEKYPGKLSEEEKLQLAEKKNNIYRTLLGEMSPSDVAGEVTDTLKELKRRKIKIAIGSSSKNARFILKNIGLFDLFDQISDGNNITRSKPDPEVFLKAAGMLELDPAQCLVVEDARAGVDAAAAGGFACAGLGDAAFYERADYPLHEFSEILGLV